MKRLVLRRDARRKLSRRSRPLLGLLVAATLALAATLGLFAATPALAAYGAENWQIGVSGTGVVPGTGQGFGVWGWCAFGGGITSGNTGDCEISHYALAPAGGGLTCEVSLDITSWSGSGGTFVITGTATVNPTSLTGPCLALIPISPSFTGADTGIPAAPGHYNKGSLLPGLPGELQIQVVQIQ